MGYLRTDVTPPEEKGPPGRNGTIDRNAITDRSLWGFNTLKVKKIHRLVLGRKVQRRNINSGAAGRIRTSDRLVRSQVLYPAELQPRAR